LGLITGAPIESPRFEVPSFTRPDQVGATFENDAWQIEPVPPRLPANLVFLTDERAISYAESVIGTVQNNRLGRIVGRATAGANGNRTDFLLPGGYAVSWTGLRVRNRDGSQHHIIGIRPDVAVTRTITGVRAGRDEVLERGLVLVRERAARP
jgi:C-terminal processing protease CtpA/Prc